MINKTLSNTKLKSPNSSRATLGSNSINYTSEISFKNKFRCLMKDILRKLDDYKQQKNNNNFDVNQIKSFLEKQIAQKKGEYYDFVHEEDTFLLKILIQFLYEELEKTLSKSKKKQYENLSKIKQMKKTLNDYEKLLVSPEPVFLKNDKEENYQKNFKLCLEKLTQFNELLRSLRTHLWRVINDDIEYEKIFFKSDQLKTDFVTKMEEVCDKINKSLENNVVFLQSFSVFDYSEDETSFDEGRITAKPINALEVRKLNTSGNENSSPFRNISNCGEPNGDRIEKENEYMQRRMQNRQKSNGDTLKKGFIVDDYKRLQDENYNLKLKIEELRKEFSLISSNVIRSMNERDIHSKQLLSENEQLLRKKNLNTIDFQTLEQKYQNKLIELKKDLRLSQEKILKLIEEKQDLVKENKELRLIDKESSYSTKANSMQIEQLNNLLNETQKELSKMKMQYNLLVEKLENFQREKTKMGGNDNHNLIKSYEKNIEDLVIENKELNKILEKMGREKNELQNEIKRMVMEKNNNSNMNKNFTNNLKKDDESNENETNFNDLTEIQLLSNMVLLFSKYKNNELEDKNRIIIEKYLKESQKDFFQSMENSIEEYRRKCFFCLENLKDKISNVLILYQDLKWLLGIIEENKNTVESISAKNYENLVKTLKEENFIKSDSINKKIAQWNKEHNHLKEELEKINQDLSKFDSNHNSDPKPKESSKINAEMEELRMIVSSLGTENRELKTSVNKLNEEMLNVSSINQKYLEEIKSLKQPEKEDKENAEMCLYSNESFGQIEEKKQKNKHGDENADMQLEMLQMQAIAIEQFLMSFESNDNEKK